MRAYPTIARICVLGLCAGLTACASPVARRPAPPSAGEQGGSWEVVMPGGQTAPELVMDWESTRRDDPLSFRDETWLTDADKPSLDNIEYLYLPHRADVLLYYSTDGGSWRDRGGYGGGAYGWNRGAYARPVYRGRW